MAKKADLGEPRGDPSRRTTIHNLSSHALHQDNLDEDEPTSSTQLQQYINQNKVLARRNGILSSRITELEDKITVLNDELVRLRKNDSLKLALELVEKNLVNSFNVSMKQLQRIRVENGVQASGADPSAGNMSSKVNLAKKDERKPALSTKVQAVKTKSTSNPFTSNTKSDTMTTKKHEPEVQIKPEIPQFFKKLDENDSTSKFLAILDELDSDDVSDIRQVGVFAKEPTIIIDDGSDKDVSDVESPSNAVEGDTSPNQDKSHDENDFLAEFGRHESSFVEEPKERKEKSCSTEPLQRRNKRKSIIPDMLDYEALLESLKSRDELKDKQNEDKQVEEKSSDSDLEEKSKPSQKTRKSNASGSDDNKAESEDEDDLEKRKADTDSVSDLKKSVTKETTPSTKRPNQRRLKRIQIKEDSPAYNFKDDTQASTTQSTAQDKDIHSHEVIELDQSPERSTQKKATTESKNTKRKPLSTLTNNVSKPTKKRKRTNQSKDWGLDIFDLRNA